MPSPDTSAGPPLGPDSLRRSDAGLLGGVSAAVMSVTGWHPTKVRIVFVLLSVVGVGAPLYAAGWLLLADRSGERFGHTRPVRDVLGLAGLAVVSVLGLVSADLVRRVLLDLVVDSLPLVLIAFGAFCFWVTRAPADETMRSPLSPASDSNLGRAATQADSAADPTDTDDAVSDEGRPASTAPLIRRRLRVPVFGPVWLLVTALVAVGGLALTLAGAVDVWLPIATVLVLLGVGSALVAVRVQSPVVSVVTGLAVVAAMVPLAFQVPMDTTGGGGTVRISEAADLLAPIDVFGGGQATTIDLTALDPDAVWNLGPRAELELNVTVGDVDVLAPANTLIDVREVGVTGTADAYAIDPYFDPESGDFVSPLTVRDGAPPVALDSSAAAGVAEQPDAMPWVPVREPAVGDDPAHLTIVANVGGHVRIRYPAHAEAAPLEMFQACVGSDRFEGGPAVVDCAGVSPALRAPTCFADSAGAGADRSPDHPVHSALEHGLGEQVFDCADWLVVNNGFSQHLACAAGNVYVPCADLGDMTPPAPAPAPETLGTSQNPVFNAPADEVARNPTGMFPYGRFEVDPGSAPRQSYLTTTTGPAPGPGADGQPTSSLGG